MGSSAFRVEMGVGSWELGSMSVKSWGLGVGCLGLGVWGSGFRRWDLEISRSRGEARPRCGH